MARATQLPDTTVWHFFDEVLLHCAHCTKPVRTKRDAEKSGFHYLVACKSCGKTSEVQLGVDDNIQLLLQTPCCGQILWAANEEHLEWLEDFTSAGIRPARRPDGSYYNSGLRTRMPKWMKIAKNRNEVLHGLSRLRGILDLSRGIL